MRLISIAAMATALMSGASYAHTLNIGAEAASALLALVAASEQPEAPGSVQAGDLSRSAEQVRRARLATMRRNSPQAAFRIAAQKPPM